MLFLTFVLLAVMEVSLSFDNAIINASVLRNMPAVWQRRFLTWGMPVAVFGMRLIFPVVLVACAGWISIPDVVLMAINDPESYAEHLSKGRVLIDAFGGIFLLTTFLSFHCDDEKEIHWFPWIEKPLAKLDINAVGFMMGFLVAAMTYFSGYQMDIAIGGSLGAVIFIVLDQINFQKEGALKAGLASFLYLEVLDASCSFDGVIAAFVLTNNIFLIMAGLGIGALAIRSLTLYLVRGGILQDYRYLEHGAHYGIGALAIIMLTDIFRHVPEPVTGMIGIGFIALSLFASIIHNRKNV